MTNLLEVNGVTARYELSTALSSATLSVPKGTVVGVVGVNGAGKTTLFRVIAGLLGPASGSVVYDGRDITQTRVDWRARNGIAFLPESRELFGHMTVLDNLCLGAVAAGKSPKRHALKDDLDVVFSYFPRLEERAKQPASSMSGGEQQMLAIGRLLMGQPSLVLLDEPSLGLSPLLVKEMFQIVRRMREELGLTVVVAEQNTNMVLKNADTVYSLNRGETEYLGSAAEARPVLAQADL